MKSAASVRRDISVKSVVERYVSFALNLPHGFAWIVTPCTHAALGSFGWSTPFKLFLLGFVLMFAGIMVIMIATVLFGASVDTGAIIWVFPLPPIGFGTGPYAFWVVLLGVALTVLGLILFIVLRKRAR